MLYRVKLFALPIVHAMDSEVIIQKPALYVIATPIGNLKDITLRAIEILKLCDIILSEDTRKSKIIFQKYEIHTHLKSFRIHNLKEDIAFTLKQLQEEKAIGFITDAGTPNISDPGSHLIRAVREKLSTIPIIPIPGPSALSTVLSITGWQTNPCLYLGFLSNKKNKRLEVLKQYHLFNGCIVIYESVHRVQSLLEDIFLIFPERELIVAREMTKKFEEYILMNQQNFKEKISLLKLKGEFTIVISPLF